MSRFNKARYVSDVAQASFFDDFDQNVVMLQTATIVTSVPIKQVLTATVPLSVPPTPAIIMPISVAEPPLAVATPVIHAHVHKAAMELLPVTEAVAADAKRIVTDCQGTVLGMDGDGAGEAAEEMSPPPQGKRHERQRSRHRKYFEEAWSQAYLW